MVSVVIYAFERCSTDDSAKYKSCNPFSNWLVINACNVLFQMELDNCPSPEIVKTLIGAGADTNAKKKDGWIAMMRAPSSLS